MASGRALKNGESFLTYRKDFPVLSTKMHGRTLAFLDSAASAQKPQAVIDAMIEVMEQGYSNIHRGLYEISQNLTQKFEEVRAKVARFIGAESEKNIVFTRNATEGINLVAQSWGRMFLKEGDEIILTEMEHHANIVPWQILAGQVGAVIKVVPVLPNGTLDIDALPALLSPKTRIVGFVHISNALGTINPAKKIIELVRGFNPDIRILIDGSQAVVHSVVNVTELDADFYVFTGHKLYGPTGIGVLYGKYDLLEAMPPYQGGGDMIENVSFEGTTYRIAPYKFEAGTPPIVEVIGLGAAIDYVESIGMEQIAAHEADLLAYATASILAVDGVAVHANIKEKAGILSFTMRGPHPADIGMVLDQCGVAVRAGHHCCMPLMKALGVGATARASFALYSNREDVDALTAGLHKVRELFGSSL